MIHRGTFPVITSRVTHLLLLDWFWCKRPKPGWKNHSSHPLLLHAISVMLSQQEALPKQRYSSLKLVLFLNLRSVPSHFLHVISDGLNKEGLLLAGAGKICWSVIRSSKEVFLLLLMLKNAKTSLTSYQTHQEDMQDRCSLIEPGSSKALIEGGESEWTKELLTPSSVQSMFFWVNLTAHNLRDTCDWQSLYTIRGQFHFCTVRTFSMSP